MADIDMIPRSYRDAQRVRRALRRFAIALALLVAASALAAGAMRWRVAKTEPRLAQLRAAAAQAGGDAARLAQLQTRHAALEQNVAALEALRAGGTVGRLAGALEGALGADMWITGIRYARSEQLIPPAAGVAAPGDLQLLRAGVQESWRVTRRLDLAGAALSYPALTQFLRAFAARPGLTDVQLVDSVAPGGETASIGFNVTALVGAAAGSKP
ncbi:MAG: hypothetical protein V4693_21650 [Pseudomonadota bacterium]